jgi:hypothetical protein
MPDPPRAHRPSLKDGITWRRARGVGTVSALTKRAALLAVAVMLVCASVCNAADGPLPSTPAVDALLADGPYCGAERVSDAPGVAGTPPHIKVIYAHASDVPDRFALFGSAIQRYTKAAAAKVALSSDKTLRLDRGSSCGAAFLDIETIVLGHPVAFYATSSVLDDIQSRLPDRPGVNYLVFVDFALPTLSAAAGSWSQDDSPWATNVANMTAHSRYAYLEGGGDDFFGSQQLASQYADQVLHEVLHTLGAVQPSAPHFSGGAHCYELYDVMCYTPKDGTTDGYLNDCDISSDAPNPGKPLDCGSDDYFNASPAPGSYLAAHWNLYNSAFLCDLKRCGQAPAAPVARLAIVAADGHAVTVSAASTSDPDGSVVSFVWDLDGDGVYDTAGPSARTVVVAGRGAQRLTVAAVDNDNLVATATITVDAHSAPDQVVAASSGSEPGGAPAISDPTSVQAAAIDSPKIGVAASRIASAARLQLTVGGHTTLKQLRERGLRGTLAASRDVRVGLTVRRGTRVLAHRGFAATQRPKDVTLHLSNRQLRDFARRRATTLTVEVSAAGASSLRRRIVILRTA